MEIDKRLRHSFFEHLPVVAFRPLSKTKFRALFLNPHRGDLGLVGDLALGELHGEMVNLSQDPRADYKSQIPLPSCPHCHKANFYKLKRLNNAMQFFCPACNEIIQPS
jgi:hypothetical protein